MSYRSKDFRYSGAATLHRIDDATSSNVIQGHAVLTGKVTRKLIPVGNGKTEEGLVESVFLSGIFTANAPIPDGFVPPILRIKNGHKLSLTGEGGIPTALLCTVERMEDERSAKILHAGY